jgi:hypothetical protein
VADDWCWFVLREKYCWLVAAGWFVLREKYCWLVADKPNEQSAGLQPAMGIPERGVVQAYFETQSLCAMRRATLAEYHIMGCMQLVQMQL